MCDYVAQQPVQGVYPVDSLLLATCSGRVPCFRTTVAGFCSISPMTLKGYSRFNRRMDASEMTHMSLDRIKTFWEVDLAPNVCWVWTTAERLRLGQVEMWLVMTIFCVLMGLVADFTEKTLCHIISVLFRNSLQFFNSGFIWSMTH